GVLLEYYEREIFGSTNEVTTQLAFVGSLRNIMGSLCMLPANLAYSFVGHKIMLLLSTLLSTLGVLLSGTVTEMWQLYLFYSVFTGCGMCLFHVPLIRIVPNWFDESSRSTAFGIITSTMGVGGLLVPLTMSSIERNLGSVWIFRILAIVVFVTGMIACAIIKDTEPPTTTTSDVSSNEKENVGDKKKQVAMDFTILKMRKVLLWLGAYGTQTFVQGIPLIFLPSYAKYIGLGQEQGTVAISLLLGMSVPGSIIAGIVADRIGNINTLTIYVLMEALTTALIWTFVNNFQTLQLYGAIYGFFFNSMASLGSALAISIVGMERFPSAMSLLLLTSTLCAMGSTVASFIEGKVNQSIQPYLSYKIMAVAGYVVSFIFLLVLRSAFHKKKVFVKV
ncbi:major facilitator superfamily domain-containing protein, partial [Phascolomyces articulosus]